MHMRLLSIEPELYKFASCKDFVEEFKVGKGDLLVTSKSVYETFLAPMNLGCDVIFKRDYGAGEPTDIMVEAMYEDIAKMGSHKRVVAIGGGGVLDIAKLFAIKETVPVAGLYDGSIKIEKDKELILVPTTCGTGSEVTNISILALTKQNTKKGLAGPELFADYAVLVPELLQDIPFGVFATSSIDALVHSVESILSPKASEATRMFGYKAIEMILPGYMKIAKDGPEALAPLIEDFLVASTYAGISFGNAGCAAVHALSYPLGATYHVAHGEANYAMFTGVMFSYMEVKQDGEIAKLNKFMADILGCTPETVYVELEKLLNNLVQKKPLREYGMKEEEIELFADSVMANQGRLMANNFVELNRDKVVEIYKKLY